MKHLAYFLLMMVFTVGFILFFGFYIPIQLYSKATKEEPVKLTHVQKNTNTSHNVVLASTVQSFPLRITSPTSDAVVYQASITVKGVTRPEAIVTINGTELRADGQGQFNYPIYLEYGENSIMAVARDETAYEQKEVKIFRE